jgi:hypothetical protein
MCLLAKPRIIRRAKGGGKPVNPGHVSSSPGALLGLSTRPRPYIDGIVTLDLSDDEKLALAPLLTRAIEDDRYPLSPRIRTLRAILAKPRPEPVREPLPPPKVYALPRAKRRHS